MSGGLPTGIASIDILKKSVIINVRLTIDNFFFILFHSSPLKNNLSYISLILTLTAIRLVCF